jgi:hypothetical protein
VFERFVIESVLVDTELYVVVYLMLCTYVLQITRVGVPNFDTCLNSTHQPNYTKMGVEFRAGRCRN